MAEPVDNVPVGIVASGKTPSWGGVGFLARPTGSYEPAADLAGERFAGALVGCGRYRPGGAPALAWLLGIAKSELRESARRGRVDQRAPERLGMPPLALDDDDLARLEELAGEGERALSLLERLPAAQRAAVRARVLEDRPQGASRQAGVLGAGRPPARQSWTEAASALIEEKE